MKWVLKNKNSGLYFKNYGVGGNNDSFTENIEKAHLFSTRQEARDESNIGEVAVSYERELLLKRPSTKAPKPVAHVSKTFVKDGDIFDLTHIDIRFEHSVPHHKRIHIYGSEVGGKQISGRALAEDIAAYLNSPEFAAKKIV